MSASSENRRFATGLRNPRPQCRERDLSAWPSASRQEPAGTGPTSGNRSSTPLVLFSAKILNGLSTPSDDRIVSLGLHHDVNTAIGHDVIVTAWWMNL
jgi:hypothetical protein